MGSGHSRRRAARCPAAQRLARGALAASLLSGTSVAAALAGAQPAYDRHIEEAAIRMLQPKLGDIRGPLDLDTGRHLFPPLSERVRLQGAPALSAPLAPAGAPQALPVTHPRTGTPSEGPAGKQPRAEGSIIRY